MKTIKIFIIACVYIVLVGKASAQIIVDGNVYLENQTSHLNINVIFNRTAPSSLSDTALTDNNGHFSRDLEAGIYRITYAKAGYETINLPEQPIYSSLTLNDTTLRAYDIFGSISGVLTKGSYQVGTNLHVDAGDTLVLEPGVQLFFKGDVHFIILGVLLARGNEKDSIVFSNAPGWPSWAGLRFEGTLGDSSLLSYCIVKHSSKSGIRLDSTYLEIENSMIESNNTSSAAPGALRAGAGIYMENSVLSMKNSIIRNNQANDDGGGICTGWDNQISIFNSKILNNIGVFGGGICIHGKIKMTLDRVEIGPDSAQRAGGIYFNIYRYEGDIVINNSIIHSCKSLDGGEAISLRQAITSSPLSFIMTNVTIANNAGPAVRILEYDLTGQYTTFHFKNCIFAYNGGPAIEGAGIDSIRMEYCNSWNNIQGNYPQEANQWLGVNVTTNKNGDSCDAWSNIQMDPLFENISLNDFHLKKASPCINAGTSIGAPNYDFDGNIRSQTDEFDIGAFEYGSKPECESPEFSPESYVIGFNSPNPFNPTTNIPFKLILGQQGVIKIFTIRGEIVLEKAIQGTGTLTWDASNLSNGIYILKARIGNKQYSRKLVLQR